jgi:hypothetical protein
MQVSLLRHSSLTTTVADVVTTIVVVVVVADAERTSNILKLNYNEGMAFCHPFFVYLRL